MPLRHGYAAINLRAVADVRHLCDATGTEPSRGPGQSSGGAVVADAVLVVPSGVSTDHVMYAPMLPTSRTVDIYAKWSDSVTKAQAVTYTVQQVGGPLSQQGI